MEQWLNLLIQVAKPVFTTLVYTGTNTLLNSLQEDFKSQQKSQTKLFLNSLGIREEKATGIQEFIQEFTSNLDLTNWNAQESFDEERILKQQLAAQQYQTISKLADRIQETTLKLPELQKTLENWPLRLFPEQILESRSHQDPIPLRIFLAFPNISCTSDECCLAKQEIEPILSQGLREFLSQNYSLHSQISPTEFLGGAWSDRGFHGEASIKALFGILKSVPTLILETEIENNSLNFRMAYWGLQQEKYCYETIFKFSYKTFLEESAKARALKWKETQDKLLALGKPREEIERLGGDNAINLAILEEVEALKTAGIDLEELNFSYRINRKDFEALCQFLSLCHCLIAGWIADIYYLIYYNIPPHLPEWLPQLSQMIADKQSLDAIARTTVLIYREIFKSLANEKSDRLPELALQLAQSLVSLSDCALAKEQVYYSLQMWLQQRQLSQLSTLETILTTEDREYLESLKTCLSKLEDESGVTHLEGILKATENQFSNTLVNGKVNQRIKFALSRTLTDISGKVSSLAINSDEPKLAIEIDNNRLELWSLDKKNAQLSSTQKLAGHSGKVLSVAFSPDGQILASSDKTPQRSHIKIWDLQTGKPQRSLFGHKQAIHSLAIGFWQLENKPFLASGSHKIKLWDLQTGESFLTLFGHKELVYSLAISRDGQTLASGSKDKTVRIWDLRTGDLLNTLAGHHSCVKTVAVSPDGQMLVSGSDDATIKLWQLKTGKLLHTFQGHRGAVRAIAIAPNCQYLISASQDTTIKIWHLHKRNLLQTLNSHNSAVNVLAIAPDGCTLISGSEDKTIKIWRTL
jgi:WD40 repeat protein